MSDLATEESTIVPWGERPAFVVLGHSEPMRVRPKADERLDLVERVIEANVLDPLATPPAALSTMRTRAEANGWSGRELWGLADVIVRTLTPIPGSESKRFVEAVTRTVSVSLRLEREGHRAYAIWGRASNAVKWTYVGGGLDGVHGLKITAVRNALAES